VETGFCGNPGSLPVPEKIVDGAVDAAANASGCRSGADNRAGIGFRDVLSVLCTGIRMAESSLGATDSAGERTACKGMPHRVQNPGYRAPRSAPQDVQNMDYLPLSQCFGVYLTCLYSDREYKISPKSIYLHCRA
jgi:hypothetical protein